MSYVQWEVMTCYCYYVHWGVKSCSVALTEMLYLAVIQLTNTHLAVVVLIC